MASDFSPVDHGDPQPYEDRGEFAQWVGDATSAKASREQRAEGLRRQADYMAALVAQRRRDPTDDLLGAMVLARDEGDRLCEDELVVLCFGLLAAGFETRSWRSPRRLSGLRLAIDADEVRWQPSVLLRGPTTLPVTW
jgi:hypothetical protein